MIQIRRNVFETNSSSTHSVSISYKNNNLYNSSYLEVDDWDNRVHIKFGEFGWEIKNYSLPYNKLQYIVTMLVETEGKNLTSVNELFETPGFKLINKTIADYCHCEGIWIDEDMSIEFYEWNGTHYYIKHNGYIDHQSCEDYNSVQDFLNDYGVDIVDFIFNDGVVVHTDNDNH